MRADGLEAIALDIPLKKDFGGSTYHVLKRSTVITRLRTQGGLVSEVYNGDNRAHGPEIARVIRDELAPRVRGASIFESERIWETMFALTHQPIPCAIEEVEAFVGGDVPVANYEFTGSQELADEVSKWVGDRAAVLMANHGLLTVGKSPKDALKIANLVELTAEIVWGARQLGTIVPLPDTTREKMAPFYKMLRGM